MGGTTQQIGARELLVLARKAAAASRLDHGTTPSKRLKLCLQLLDGAEKSEAVSDFAVALALLHTDYRHYWIGTFYTLLLPAAVRRAQAAYFTPPNLSQALLRLVRSEGFDPLRGSAIDPAAGGAAFLSTLAAEMSNAGATAQDIVRRLHGVEIDRGLGRLSEALIAARIERPILDGSVVSVKDSLRCRFQKTYDLVIANPPYGRVSSSEAPNKLWENVCHPGHINKYALFVQICFRLAKAGGLVALVLPSSFVAGPLYGRLRTFMRRESEVLALGSVTTRRDIFADVAQDVSFLVARVGNPHALSRAVSFGTVTGFGPFKLRGASKLSSALEDPWTMGAEQSGEVLGGSTLADYGAVLRSGYFVWNRELERMSKSRRAKLDFPLIWAKNIRAEELCSPKARKRRGVDFVRFDAESAGIVRTQALVMQRTTNNSQPRRLVAARVSPTILKKWGGFVSENHTIVVTGPDVRTLNLLLVLLNSAAVDQRYRQVSGTASVSVSLLREIDLPSPEALSAAVSKHGACGLAVEHAYADSAKQNTRARA